MTIETLLITVGAIWLFMLVVVIVAAIFGVDCGPDSARQRRDIQRKIREGGR